MQEVVTIRDASLEIAPSFQASVHETPVNVYRMKVDAQSSDARRMSWTWRSPGNRLICSPQAFVEFELDCHVPYNFTEAEALSCICGHVDRSAGRSTVGGGVNEEKESDVITLAERENSAIAGIRSYGYHGRGDAVGVVLAAQDAAGLTDVPGSRGYRAGLAFAEGDAVGNCIESIQYNINGCSISHQNWHLFKRSLDRCWVPSRVMQRVYHGAGGSWNAYDCNPLSGQVSRADYFTGKAKYVQGTNGETAPLITGAGGSVAAVPKGRSGAATVEGFTADSGLARRMKNLFASITGKSTSQYPGSAMTKSAVYNGSSFKVRVRFPLCGAVFNPCWGESGLSRSCPYQRLALAIPNLNQGALTILYKDLEKTVIRRLGRTLSRNKNALRGTLINNSENTTVAIAKKNNAGGAATDDDEAGVFVAPFTCKLSTSRPPALFLTYLRLQAFRRPPEVASFTTYRTQTYLGPMPTEASMGSASISARPEAFDKDVGAVPYLKCDGEQVVSKSAAIGSFAPDLADSTRVWKVSFENLQFAQPPSYIFICAQKDSKMFSHQSPINRLSATLDQFAAELTAGADPLAAGGLHAQNIATEAYATTPVITDQMKPGSQPTAAAAILTAAWQAGNDGDGLDFYGLQPSYNSTNDNAALNDQSSAKVSNLLACGRYMSQNQDSNLSITKLDILVQSSVGSFKLSGDSYPFLRDQQIIFDEHRRNCCTDYFEKSGFSDWKKRGSCVLLSVSQYLHGLGSSAGVAFPIQITARGVLRQQVPVHRGPLRLR